MTNPFLGPAGQELALTAISELGGLGLAPTPQNYAVWAQHLSGAAPKLSAEIKARRDAGAPISDQFLGGLHARFIAPPSLEEAVMAAGGQMAAELAHVLSTLEKAGRGARDYGKTLEGASDAFSAEGDPTALRRVVDSLAVATRQMQRQSDELEQRLQHTSEEVRELRNKLETVREEALTDGLTGIANRKRFDDALSKLLVDADADSAGAPLSLLIADIDHFKRFNDTWGHQTGDQIIRFVAGCLARVASERHVVARFGGEEFAVLMPGEALADAVEYAELMRAGVESKRLKRKSTNEDLGNVTISIGVAQRQPGEEAWEFVERADAALYASKQGGRNIVTSAPRDVDQAAQARPAA